MVLPDESPSYFAIITADILFSKDLTSTEKIFLAHVSTLQKKSGCCYAGNQYFSEVLGVHKNSLNRIINNCVKHGFLTSKIIRDGKQIIRRELTLRLIPINVDVDTPINVQVENPINVHVGENNTSINNTSINRREIPPEINPVSWNEFIQHRKEIRKPMSDLAMTKAINQLKQFSFEQQQEIIDYSITGRYTGLYTDKIKNNVSDIKTFAQKTREKNKLAGETFLSNVQLEVLP